MSGEIPPPFFPLLGRNIDTADVEEWAENLVSVLQNYVNNTLGQVQTVFDTQGRVIVTPGGLWAYDANGNAPISPDLVEIDTEHLVDAAITTAKIGPQAVDTVNLAALAVQAAQLADSAVTATKIANLAVGSGAIQAAAIGTAHIANAAITSALIGDLEVVTAKIDDLAVNSGKIANLAVGTGKIADLAVTTAKIANLAVTDAKIQDLDADKIQANTITAAKIAANTITAAEIAAGTITATELAALTITSGVIAADAITGAKIAAGAIIAGDGIIANAAVETLQLAGQAVTIPVGAYTAGTSTQTGGDWTTAQSATITSTGAPIMIMCSGIFVNGSAAYSMHFRVRRGSTTIWYVNNAFAATHIGPMTVAIEDTPGPGSVTYTFQYYPVCPACSNAMTARSITLLEVKR